MDLFCCSLKIIMSRSLTPEIPWISSICVTTPVHCMYREFTWHWWLHDAIKVTYVGWKQLVRSNSSWAYTRHEPMSVVCLYSWSCIMYGRHCSARRVSRSKLAAVSTVPLGSCESVPLGSWEVAPCKSYHQKVYLSGRFVIFNMCFTTWNPSVQVFISLQNKTFNSHGP